MRKIVDDLRLIYKCCKMYYEEQLSQQQIAEQLEVSRVTVSRMLATGRSTGIVHIQINYPDIVDLFEIEQKLMQSYDLKDVSVVENSAITTRYEHMTKLGSMALHILERYLCDGDIVGVSMGMTLRNVYMSASPNMKEVKCTFVPTMGGLGTGGSCDTDIHSNRIAMEFARIFGAKYVDFFEVRYINWTDLASTVFNRR